MQTEAISALSEVTVIFTLVLAFALLIERFLEVTKTAYDLLDSRYDWHRFWTRQTERTRDFLENRLKLSQRVSPRATRAVLARFNEMLLGPEDGYTGTLPVLSGNLVRAAGIRLSAKIVAIGLGIGLARAFDLDLLALSGLDADHRLGIALTGVAIGLGPGPVHKIITTLEKRQARRADAISAGRTGEERANG